MRACLVLVAIVALAALSASAEAKNNKGKGHKFGHGGGAIVRFTAADDTVVRVYFNARPVVWTGLPPGIAKNYARGKPLPPGIAKKALPVDLLARLPARPGYAYARVGQDVVLIDATTLLVVDIIERVFD